MDRIITQTSNLKAFCDEVAQDRYITVDTEFIRERTYYPQLCLIQIAGEDALAAIDPLSYDIDLAPLFELMQDEKVLKVFHAGKQDIEIFYQLSGSVPSPVYDTQIAAMVCGYGDQVGYESIVNQVLGEQLDKSQRFTDWARRPLTQAQLEYALGDVTYLRGVYEKLGAEISGKGRENWMDEELENLIHVGQYAASPEDAWRRLKKRDRRPRYLARLRALAQWREEEAVRQNKPRGWVLNDDALQEMALTNPKDVSAIKKGRAIKKHLSQLDVSVFVSLLKEANELPKEECPRLPKKESLPTEMDATKDVLKILLKLKCQEHQVASKLVATIDDLTHFLLGHADIPFMHGWRYEVFGKDAEAVLAGEKSLVISPSDKQVSVC